MSQPPASPASRVGAKAGQAGGRPDTGPGRGGRRWLGSAAAVHGNTRPAPLARVETGRPAGAEVCELARGWARAGPGGPAGRLPTRWPLAKLLPWPNLMANKVVGSDGQRSVLGREGQRSVGDHVLEWRVAGGALGCPGTPGTTPAFQDLQSSWHWLVLGAEECPLRGQISCDLCPGGLLA